MLLTVDLERLDVRKGDRVLDAGCGEGRHCFGCLERGAQVVGLDLDFDSLRLPSRRLAERAGEIGTFGAMLQGNTFALPFADQTFDRVICSEVMEHVHDFVAAARELARVTKPGGRLAITIPTATSEHLYLRLGDEYFESPGGHIRIFRPRDLARGLARAGLSTVGVGFAHGFHTPYWVLRSVMRLPDADQSRLVRLYRKFLIHATTSKAMDILEKRILDYICPMKKLSVIICCYNEIATIESIVAQTKAVKLGTDWEREIIVVDNFSTDGTREWLQQNDDPEINVYYHDQNMGKGLSIRTGIAHMSGDYMLIQDADSEYDPAEHARFAAKADETNAAAIFGSRVLNGQANYEYAHAYWGVRFLSTLHNLLFGGRLTDVLTATKMVRHDVIKPLHLTCTGFDLDTEITVKIY